MKRDLYCPACNGAGRISEPYHERLEAILRRGMTPLPEPVRWDLRPWAREVLAWLGIALIWGG